MPNHPPEYGGDLSVAETEQQQKAAEEIVSQRDSSPPRGNPFPVVGIGASAGGLEAFGQLLSTLRADTGMAFVLVQHLDPQHESTLTEILTSLTSMPVVTVRDGMEVEPNHVYVIPPNTSMVIEGSQLRLAKREAGLHVPIDIFFCSLAAVQGSRAIGVVLSGNASDGSLGLRAIKAECGITFAQDESTARFGGMPRNAIATGAVDYVLAPADIGIELGQLGRHPYLMPARPGDAASETLPDGESELKRVFALLNTSTGVDFSHYKPTTVRRRIGRRMMVLRTPSVSEYARYAEQHPAEVRELYRDLLISVTSFFRDPEAYASLTRLLAERLGEKRQRREPVRVWVPGCATGEEVYSIAICLNELLREMKLTIPIQLFGTDLSEIALDRARHGTYGENIVEDVSPQRLSGFFTKVEGGFQISKAIRENCVFARHDVIKDPPFSRVDLVTCRNLLIYLDLTAQRRVLPVFHYALKNNGYLMLGSAETAAAAPELFSAMDKEHGIYQKTGAASRIALDGIRSAETLEATHLPLRAEAATRLDLQKRLDRLIQSKYSPDAVLVNSDLQIVQFRGHTSAYLDPSPGDASLNLLRMARESLVVPLRRILQAAVEAQHSVKERGVMLDGEGRHEEIGIEVTPVYGDTPGERYWLIVFTPGERSRNGSAEDSAEKDGENRAAAGRSSEPIDDETQVGVLQRELAETREYLRGLAEEYEAHAEELRAANEEARSANEELQSTNEELGTAKEELQSANEELITINEELQSRNLELNGINSDLRNLLAAVSVAILMVDSELRVRRFNTAAENLLGLKRIDLGRPVAQLRERFKKLDLEANVRSVIESLHPIRVEEQDNNGHWAAVTFRPYRTIDDRIAGAVITIQDIDPLKRGLEAAEEARDYADSMVETVREPLVVLDSDLRVQRATPAFYETFLVSQQETKGRFLYDLGNGQWNRPRLRELIGSALFGNQPFQDYEVEHDFPHIGRRTMRLNGRRIPRHSAESRMLLLAIEDVTERREAAEIRFRRLFETAKDGILVVATETDTVLDVNPYLLEVTGFAREKFVGAKLSEVAAFARTAEMATLMRRLHAEESLRIDDIAVSTADGRTLSMELVANSYRAGNQPVAQLNFRDISWRKEQEESLRRAVEEKAVLVREIHHRIKNNLQVIVSMLSLQSDHTDDPQAIAFFEEMEARVRAIAHIHETLYATPDLAQIEFGAYLANLVHELLALHSAEPRRIKLDLVTEEMVLDMEQAIPLGLIANELVLNGLKHGLPAGHGTLTVHLNYRREAESESGTGGSSADKTLDEGWGELRVSDSGPGLPENIDLANARSMGFRLLGLLVRQLQGEVKFQSGPGATVIVGFPLTYEKRPPVTVQAR